MTRRRLAYLSLETPREGQASFTHVHEIMDGLREEGWTVELFATRSGGASSGAGPLAKLREQVALQLRLGRRLREFDALFVRSHFSARLISGRARAVGVPVVHEINGRPDDVAVTYPLLRPLAAALRWLYRSQYRDASHLVAVTPGLAQWASSFAGHDRVSVVSNGANTALFRPDGPLDLVPSSYVVFVGGLVAWHGVGTMLAALDDPSWPAGVRLVVAGDGVERGLLQAAVGHPRLEWLGRVDYRDIPALLRGALAALCMIEDPDGRSATGVAPLKLFEAMACGAPVVVSDLPYQAELVRDAGAGIVVGMGDPAALAAAVRRLAADGAQARDMGRRGAAFVARHASWRARAADTARILDAAIARTG